MTTRLWSAVATDGGRIMMATGKFNAPMEIGLIGLGVMGANLALNIAGKGHKISVYNRPQDRPEDFLERAGDLARNIRYSDTLLDLVASVRAPRPIILMVTAGDAVDAQIAALRPLLSPHDIIIDAGNSNFRDTIRRCTTLRDKGLSHIGMGVSGGEEGARHGPSIMFGGDKASYERVEPILKTIAARFNDDPCCAHIGPDGAGHFVKMIHNGIEYADMQMIAEVYGLLRDGLGLAAGEIATIFERWNKGRLNSYLIEITATVLKTADPKSGKPMVDMILDRAGQKGTGRWSAIEAQTLGVPATTIEEAVAARALSAIKDERQAASGLYGATAGIGIADPAAFIDQLELALFAGKINAYAQGFAVMAAASKDYGWNLPLGEIARIWRGGCIIRSQFLDRITDAFRDNPQTANLLVAPSFVTMMAETAPALRHVVAQAALAGLPVPALAAALGYFESYRQQQGVANLIQAQRDFFGAHSFERIDEEGGGRHGPWGLRNG